MRRDELKKEILNVINDKKFLNAVCIALVLAFVLLAISFVSTSRKKEVKQTSTEVVESSTNNRVNSSLSNYEDQQKRELTDFLAKVENVGRVEVMIYFKSGEVKVPALESNTQNSVTEEKDKEGGNRVNNQQNDGTKVVMSVDGNKTEPYILQVNKPEITGVVIVAEGATSSKVKYEIQTAVSSLYGISKDKVNVYPMKN